MLQWLLENRCPIYTDLYNNLIEDNLIKNVKSDVLILI